MAWVYTPSQQCSRYWILRSLRCAIKLKKGKLSSCSRVNCFFFLLVSYEIAGSNMHVLTSTSFLALAGLLARSLAIQVLPGNVRAEEDTARTYCPNLNFILANIETRVIRCLLSLRNAPFHACFLALTWINLEDSASRHADHCKCLANLLSLSFG